MMQKIELEQWPRKEIYQFFSELENPFYMVTFRVDVTALYHYVKKQELSFYYALVYLCMQALNQVQAFLYTVEQEELFLLDHRIPSFTDLKPGSEQFHIVTLPWQGTLEQFCQTAALTSRQQTGFLPSQQVSGAPVYFSCLPWVELTALTNERNFDKNDTVPRIAWGKYTQQQDRKSLQLSIEVNHRFIDGIHIGKFYEKLQSLIDALN